MPPIRAGGRPTGADNGGGRRKAGSICGRGVERTAPAPAVAQDLQTARIQSCSLLDAIEVVRARLSRLLRSPCMVYTTCETAFGS